MSDDDQEHEHCFEWTLKTSTGGEPAWSHGPPHEDKMTDDVTSINMMGDFYHNEGCAACLRELTARIPKLSNLASIELGSCYGSLEFAEELRELYAVIKRCGREIAIKRLCVDHPFAIGYCCDLSLDA